VREWGYSTLTYYGAQFIPHRLLCTVYKNILSDSNLTEHCFVQYGRRPATASGLSIADLTYTTTYRERCGGQEYSRVAVQSQQNVRLVVRLDIDPSDRRCVSEI
jgi:hypothetical protein